MKTIIYQEAGESGVVVHLADGADVDYVVDKNVPDGAQWREVDPAPIYNGYIYSVNLTPEGSGNDYEIVAKPLQEGKEIYKTAVSQQSSNRLSSTTPLVIASMEGGPALKPEWATYRADVIAELNAKLAAIDGAADAEALDTYVESDAFSAWPTEPTDPLV